MAVQVRAALCLLLSSLLVFSSVQRYYLQYAVGSPSPSLGLSANSGAVGSSLTMTGLGFASSAVVRISSLAGATTIAWLGQGGCGTAKGGISGVDSLVVSGCLSTTAGGNFEVTVTVPAMPGAPQTITVDDGTSTATAPFTITPALQQSLPIPGQNGYPESTVTDTFTITGFGTAETVSLASSVFEVGTSISCNTDLLGSCIAASSTFVVADTTGGAKTITGSGANSGLTATTTFTVRPWVSFYNSQAGATGFSFLGKAPTSLLIEGHGFTAGLIAGNSITVGGVSTAHTAVTVGSSGVFGMGSHLVVAPTTDVPFGQVDVMVAGTIFNIAIGNINQRDGTGTFGPLLGRALISSITGTVSTTDVGLLDSSGYRFGDMPNAFGYGFKPGDVITPNANGRLVGLTLGKRSHTIENNVVDSNGAIFVSTTAGSFGDPAAGTYVATFTGSTTANTINPSFNVNQILSLSFSSTGNPSTQSINYKTVGLTLSVHGFAPSTVVMVTAAGGGVTLATGTTNSEGDLSSVGVTAPDLAMGGYVALASDGINSASDSFNVSPFVDFAGGQDGLTVNSGSSGTIAKLRTGSNFGVHGLLANTAYVVNWQIIAAGSQTLGTFTTTSSGGIPGSGVSLSIPSGARLA